MESTYSTEFIIWARKLQKVAHYYNYDLMKQLNGDKQMTDVWQLPASLGKIMRQASNPKATGSFGKIDSSQYSTRGMDS